jgi:hypothetical protein
LSKPQEIKAIDGLIALIKGSDDDVLELMMPYFKTSTVSDG